VRREAEHRFELLVEQCAGRPPCIEFSQDLR
jgi:hypothetical protein